MKRRSKSPFGNFSGETFSQLQFEHYANKTAALPEPCLPAMSHLLQVHLLCCHFVVCENILQILRQTLKWIWLGIWRWIFHSIKQLLHYPGWCKYGENDTVILCIEMTVTEHGRHIKSLPSFFVYQNTQVVWQVNFKTHGVMQSCASWSVAVVLGSDHDATCPKRRRLQHDVMPAAPAASPLPTTHRHSLTNKPHQSYRPIPSRPRDLDLLTSAQRMCMKFGMLIAQAVFLSQRGQTRQNHRRHWQSYLPTL